MPTRLGFGTSGIMGAAWTTSGRLRLLESAWEEGIRHFDTAPLYGLGEAETLLGRFLRGRRDTISITTKFGLLPDRPPALLRPLIPLARGINRRLLPPLRRNKAWMSGRRDQPGRVDQQRIPTSAEAGRGEANGGSAQQGSGMEERPLRQPPIPYTAAMLRLQLEASLRKLQTDHIDYYLLHEGHADYLNPAFLESLEQFVAEGKIRDYGIGTGRWQCRCLLQAYPQQPWILQIPDTLLDHDTDWFASRSSGPLFTHSALRLDREGAGERLRQLLPAWAALRGRQADDPALASELLLTLALSRNREGCVIFSSANPARIRSNAAVLRSFGEWDGMASSWLRERLQADDGFPA